MAFIERTHLGPLNGRTKLLIDWSNSVTNEYLLVTKVLKGMYQNLSIHMSSTGVLVWKAPI